MVHARSPAALKKRRSMRLCYPIPSADPTSSEAYRQLQRQLAHKEEALAALVEAVSSLPPEVIGMPEAVQHDHVEHPVDVMVPGSKWKIVHEPVAAVQHEIVQEPMVVTPDCVSPQYASPLEESAEAVATATPASSAAQASGALGSAPPSQCAALGAGLAAAGGGQARSFRPAPQPRGRFRHLLPRPRRSVLPSALGSRLRGGQRRCLRLALRVVLRPAR
mmetsp:Transcript_60735/g.188644  ORF Transcript_60735/g.188644 Transcript_60735/m.188644 type:complete len:220 (+) Transcript_60735:122-781(+)